MKECEESLLLMGCRSEHGRKVKKLETKLNKSLTAKVDEADALRLQVHSHKLDGPTGVVRVHVRHGWCG
jgi:hypothetical protein